MAELHGLSARRSACGLLYHACQALTSNGTSALGRTGRGRSVGLGLRAVLANQVLLGLLNHTRHGTVVVVVMSRVLPTKRASWLELVPADAAYGQARSYELDPPFHVSSISRPGTGPQGERGLTDRMGPTGRCRPEAVIAASKTPDSSAGSPSVSRRTGLRSDCPGTC